MDPVAVVGREAPRFELNDLIGKHFRLEQERGRVVVLVFWSAECPWSERSDERLARMDSEWDSDEVVLLRVASNANEDPEDLRRTAQERGVDRVLRDPEQIVANLYGAMTTPHVYVIDAEGILRYKGAPDDSSWRQPEPTRNYLVEAVEAAGKGTSIDTEETPGRGCTVVRYQAEGS